MKSLVICEKPSVAADVARALSTEERFQQQRWGFESDTFVITAAAGHLLAEAPPESYDPALKKWSMPQLPIIPPAIRFEPRDDRAAARLREIRSLAHRHDVVAIVNACDAGREGELIFKLILDHLDVNKPVYRAWFASMTTEALRSAFASLRADTEFDGLETAARVRSHADWLVGMNATRAATCHLAGGRQLVSIGRVQTPTLAMVVARDLKISSFQPETFFQIPASFVATAGTYDALWMSSNADDAVDRLAQREHADQIVATVRGIGFGTVAAVDSSTVVAHPPRLFDLTELQREANRRWGWTAAVTLSVAQSCYETFKVLSYPRTDSRFLTTDMANELPSLLNTVARNVNSLASAVDSVDTNRFARVIDDTKVTDHHALIPTQADVALEQLPERERQLYELVCRRLVAAVHQDQVRTRTVSWTRVDGADREPVWFKSVTTDVVEPGWTAVEKPADPDDPDEPESESGAIPEPGERVSVADIDVTQGETTPPANFNEASLLGAMAAVGRGVEDEELEEALRDRGLGTPATRAAVIERLIKVGYVERRGRKVLSTEKGRRLIEVLSDHQLTSPELTGHWEARLREMERCHGSDLEHLRDEFANELHRFVVASVEAFQQRDPGVLADTRPRMARCPLPGCDGSVVTNQKSWTCDSWKSKEQPGCGFAVWKQRAGKKITDKQLLRFVEEIRTGQRRYFGPGQRPVLGPCPRCGVDVVERETSWGCTSFRSPQEPGCGYVIWKKPRNGSAVSLDQARLMCANGQTNATPPPREIGTCPRCGGRLLHRGKFIGCDSWKSKKNRGCGNFSAVIADGRRVPVDDIAKRLGLEISDELRELIG